MSRRRTAIAVGAPRQLGGDALGMRWRKRYLQLAARTRRLRARGGGARTQAAAASIQALLAENARLHARLDQLRTLLEALG